METYVFKAILASCLFIGFYYLFLEKEKTFKFNRFYLLSSLVLSLVLPLISIEVPQEVVLSQPEMINAPIQNIQKPISKVENPIQWQTIILVLYILVCAFLLLKLIAGIVKVKSLKGKIIVYQDIKTKILDKDISPFSFLNTIYIGKNYYINGEINKDIFLHEKEHVKSKHSFDLVFVELCKAILWLNPAVYLYKKALVDNHEFSADQSVISTSKDLKKYQYLILEEVESHQKFNFSNHFYFNNTKKRIIMMTKRKNPLSKWKNTLYIPLLAAVAFFTVQRISANNTIATTPTESSKIVKFEEEKKLIEETLTKPAENILEKNIDPDLATTIKTDTVKPPKPEKAIKAEKPSSPPAPPHDIARDVDKPAEYPAGISQFRKEFMTAFDNSKVDVKKGENTLIKAEVLFNIYENGEVENVRAVGDHPAFNEETIRAVEKINKNVNWIPAQKDGKNVKSAYKFPIMISFE